MAEELNNTLHRRSEIVAERAPDELEETVLAAEREAATHELERTYRLLRQVQAALARLRTGNYGSCTRCDLAIPEKRLEAVPWAIFCVRCQEFVDRLHVQVGVFQMPAA